MMEMPPLFYSRPQNRRPTPEMWLEHVLPPQILDGIPLFPPSHNALYAAQPYRPNPIAHACGKLTGHSGQPALVWEKNVVRLVGLFRYWGGHMIRQEQPLQEPRSMFPKA